MKRAMQKQRKPARNARPLAEASYPEKRTLEFTTRSRRSESKQNQPKSPLPAQHQKKPGIEAKMHPRPRFESAFV